jgi:YjbE family integral membrane protein
MESLVLWFAGLDWSAILQIIIIDILLGGDNAVVIALACRNLPERQRRLGVIWGSAGALVLRVILVSVAVMLLNVPALKLIGGVLLIWIGIKLIVPQDDSEHAGIKGQDKLWQAIKTIVVADLVMSLDNVVAIAGAAEQADPAHRTGLIVFGLLVSIPFIVFGSQLVLKLLDRFPVIVLLGGALLGWIAGGLIVGDVLLRPWLSIEQVQGTALYYVSCIAGAVVVVATAKLVGWYRQTHKQTTA